MSTDNNTREHAHSATTPLRWRNWRSWPSKGRYGSYALTIPQAALRLGMADYTLRREIRAGRIVAVKQTRLVKNPVTGQLRLRTRWLMLWSDLEAWWSIRAAESLCPQQRGVDRRRARRSESAPVSPDRPLS